MVRTQSATQAVDTAHGLDQGDVRAQSDIQAVGIALVVVAVQGVMWAQPGTQAGTQTKKERPKARGLSRSALIMYRGSSTKGSDSTQHSAWGVGLRSAESLKGAVMGEEGRRERK